MGPVCDLCRGWAQCETRVEGGPSVKLCTDCKVPVQLANNLVDDLI